MQAPSRVLLLGTTSGGVVSGVTSGTSQAINRVGQNELSLYVRGIGTITGGTLLIEEADYGDEYQDMVARVGQKAKQQEKDKPVDIADLARRLAAIETSKKK